MCPIISEAHPGNFTFSPLFNSNAYYKRIKVKENIELGRELSSQPLSIKQLITQVGLENHTNKESSKCITEQFGDSLFY